MSNFKISGIVTAVSPTREDNGNKPYKSCKITVKEDGEHPNVVQLDYYKGGESVKFFRAPSVGDRVNVEFNIRQNEYQGKAYNTINVWKIDVLTKAEPVAQGVYDNSDLPF